MNLDGDTVAVLGYGDPWSCTVTFAATRAPVVEAKRLEQRKAYDARYRATVAARRVAASEARARKLRDAARERMRRVRASRRGGGMIERDSIALSACGVHLRHPGGAGGNCVPCRDLVHAARTEPLLEKRTISGREAKKPGPTNENSRVRGKSPWRGRLSSMPKSEHGTQLYTKSGAGIGSRGRVQ